MSSDEKRIDEIATELARLNGRTGDSFLATLDIIDRRLDERERVEWAEIVLEIASSGWHAFESAAEYLTLSPRLLTVTSVDVLLDRGRYGVGLAGFSYEPGATYFRGLGWLLDADALAHVDAVERAGARIQARFTHASNLVTDFFRVGFTIASRHELPRVEKWSDIALEMAAFERADLATFLHASEDASTIDWNFLHRLKNLSVSAALDYLWAFPGIASHLDEHQRASLEKVTYAYAIDSADELADWLRALADVLPRLTHQERGELIGALSSLPQLELAHSLLSAVERLPLNRPSVMRGWIDGVLDFLPLNTEAARGYLSMESARSVDVIELLLGQVNLEDCRRVLQLYSEAVAGRRLTIHPVEVEATPGFRALPGTDGLNIFLPELISRYDTNEDNFALYKIALLHQLGYYEFGTFEYVADGSILSFHGLFRSFGDPALASDIFQILEDARVDWALERKFRGAASLFRRFKDDAAGVIQHPRGGVGAYLSELLRLSLDVMNPADVIPREDFEFLRRQISRLNAPVDVFVSVAVLHECYALIAQGASGSEAEDADMPDAVEFRGELKPDLVRLNLALTHIEETDVDVGGEQAEMMSISAMPDPRDVKIEEIKKGPVDPEQAMLVTDLDAADLEAEELDEDTREALSELLEQLGKSKEVRDAAYQYDEWDCVIADYRRRWCTLYEIRDVEERPEFVDETLRELRSVANNVRRRLGSLRPEMLRKVKGVEDGEELDIERTIESKVDKRAGYSPTERIYVQRQRKERDVSALFLLDMSASTDDRIPPDEDEEPVERPDLGEDDFLHDYYGSDFREPERKRIIDVEKEAVVLMAEALQDLGDSYSICGFSGYGRDQVDFYLCKDFEEAYNSRVKGRIGGIKPCRSTRMGPAIRHATSKLAATESRIKALIIISDGYPQDFDYGKDRNSRDYGIRDTTMALTEARQKGIQAFCLTVDPSGHDYLREMCLDQQYMVIQDVRQLPDELSKVYRSLTA